MNLRAHMVNLASPDSPRPLEEEQHQHQGQLECWFLMSLRTRKQKSKIDFTLLSLINVIKWLAG